MVGKRRQSIVTRDWLFALAVWVIVAVGSGWYGISQSFDQAYPGGQRFWDRDARVVWTTDVDRGVPIEILCIPFEQEINAPAELVRYKSFWGISMEGARDAAYRHSPIPCPPELLRAAKYGEQVWPGTLWVRTTRLHWPLDVLQGNSFIRLNTVNGYDVYSECVPSSHRKVDAIAAWILGDHYLDDLVWRVLWWRLVMYAAIVYGLGLGVAVSVRWSIRGLIGRRRVGAGKCRVCGYRVLEMKLCPECGYIEAERRYAADESRR